MYPDSGYKTTHAQSVCTRPFSRGEGPGDEASRLHTAATSALGQHAQMLSYVIKRLLRLRKSVFEY